MSNTSCKEDGSDFLHFFQNFKFQENSDNRITAAASKRMQMILNYYHSSKSNEENATSYLLETDLEEYFKIVDDKTSLNNYAQYIKSASSLSRNSVSDCKKWRSSLEACNFPDIDSKLSHRSTNRVEQNIEKFYHNLVKRSNCTDESFSNVKISPPGSTNSYTSVPRNENQVPSNCVKTVPNKFTTNSSDNAFTFKKPNMAPPHYRPTKNLNERTGVNERRNYNDTSCGFRTAHTELKIQNTKKFGNKGSDYNQPKESFSVKRSLGGRTRAVNNKFVPPIKNDNDSNNILEETVYEDERLKNLDPKMIELIKNEIMDHGNPITWDDIAGLQFAKKTIQEIVVWPLLRPDIFTGLRRPPKGILLFGPPGTGKTLIGKCIASQSSSTFFSISASSLTSKWVGESEKLVRTLFAVAGCHQPAVIFIDEIDSLLSQRSENEQDYTRKVKTEFLVQLDGATTHEDDRILVIGATNRPQELDEAARRRLVKRLYIPLPEHEARCEIVNRLMKTEKNELGEEDVRKIAELTDGYSGADMRNLCQEACLGPIRSIDFTQIGSIESHKVRPVNLSDFISALKVIRSSVSSSDLRQYLEWDKTYGSSGN